MNSALRPCITAGIALVGAGVIAVTPVKAPLPDAHVSDVQLTAGDTDIVIDFVRHAETTLPNSIALQTLPGAPLSDTGWDQADAVGSRLAGDLGPVAGIFGGQEQRMIETATPFLTDEGLTSQAFQAMSGLNEIGGGIASGLPMSSPGGILSQLVVLAWVAGLELVPAPGSGDLNGVIFEDRFNDAVQTMYNDAADAAHPVVSLNGNITDVAFSGEGALTAWTLMTVKNPDLAILIPRLFESLSDSTAHPFLSYAGVIEVQGNPTDGWTLVNFDGQPFPQDPGLLTNLFIEVRNVITAPQTAVWNLFEAALSGDPTAIGDAFHNGLDDIGAALLQFPGSVINDIVAAVQNLFTELAAGETLSDAFGSAILGLV